MTFGQKIKKLRSEAKITQKDLAEKLNVTFQTISKWEGDINEPDFASVRELAKIFHCSIEYLLSCEEETKEEEKKEKEKKEDSRKKLVIGICRECGKRVYEGERLHHIEKEYLNGRKEKIYLCHSCFLGPEAMEEERKEEEKQKEIALLEEKQSTKLVIGICRACGKKIHEGEKLHHSERTLGNGKIEKVIFCDSCFQNGGKPVAPEKKDNKEKKEKETKLGQKKIKEKKRFPKRQGKKKITLFGSFLNEKDQKALKWGIIVSSILLVLHIYSGITAGSSDQIVPFIFMTIQTCYFALSAIYCIFGDTIVNHFFIKVVIKSLYVKFPGLIFTFSLDGFLWLLGMKLLFGVLGFFIVILATIFAFSVSLILSFLLFIPILIKKKKDSYYEEKKI